MGHIPFGYKIENGKPVIDEVNAEKVRRLYANYLSGQSLSVAAKNAGITSYHCTAKLIMNNHHYAGDEFYPAIVNAESFDIAQEELAYRAKRPGRIGKNKQHKPVSPPTSFTMREASKYFDNPIQQAESLYSLIERKEQE